MEHVRSILGRTPRPREPPDHDLQPQASAPGDDEFLDSHESQDHQELHERQGHLAHQDLQVPPAPRAETRYHTRQGAPRVTFHPGGVDAAALEARARAHTREENHRLRTVLSYEDHTDEHASVTGAPSALEEIMIKVVAHAQEAMETSVQEAITASDHKADERHKRLEADIRKQLEADARRARMDNIRANERIDVLAASLGRAPPVVVTGSNAVAATQEEAEQWDAENLKRAMTTAPSGSSTGVTARMDCRPAPTSVMRAHAGHAPDFHNLPTTPVCPGLRRFTLYGDTNGTGRLSLLPRAAVAATPLPRAPVPRYDDSPHLSEDDDRPRSSIGREWFPKGTVKSFTGEFIVGSSCPSTNPIRWAKTAKEELENRGIPYKSWVKSVKSCMGSEVLDSFRTYHCSNRTVAIAMRLLPHKNHAFPDPFDSTGWDQLCDWLIQEYVTAAHLEALQQHIETVPCKGVAFVKEYVDVFNESCIYADYLSALLSGQGASGDVAATLNNIDVPHRRACFRKHLPPRIEAKLAAFEGSQRAVQPGWHWTLSSLQEHAAAASDVIREAGVRQQGTAQLNHASTDDRAAAAHAAPAADGLGSGADLASVLNAQLLLMRVIHDQMAATRTSLNLHESAPLLTLRGGDSEAEELHVKISEIMPNPPSAELIQQRLAERSCLACGEKSTHTKFLECPKLLAMKDVAERIDAAVARRGNSRPAARSAGPRNARVHHLDANEEEDDE